MDSHETTEHFSLRWNNYHNNLSTGFHSLLQAEDLVDVTLAAEGNFIQAHKIVLSICSPYFKALFKVIIFNLYIYSYFNFTNYLLCSLVSY